MASVLATDVKLKMVTTFDPFGAALMINRSNCIYLFKFFLCILSGHILYYLIISTGYSKHEFGTINMLYSPKKSCRIYTPTSLPRPLSSVPKVSFGLYMYFSFFLYMSLFFL